MVELKDLVDRQESFYLLFLDAMNVLNYLSLQIKTMWRCVLLLRHREFQSIASCTPWSNFGKKSILIENMTLILLMIWCGFASKLKNEQKSLKLKELTIIRLLELLKISFLLLLLLTRLLLLLVLTKPWKLSIKITLQWTTIICMSVELVFILILTELISILNAWSAKFNESSLMSRPQIPLEPYINISKIPTCLKSLH